MGGGAPGEGGGPPLPTSAHTINFFSNKHTTVFSNPAKFLPNPNGVTLH